MKKITSLLLCLMLVLSMALPAAAFSTGVTMHSGVVTLTLGADAAANARMTVEFDPNYLTYLDYETDFAVHSVRAEEGRLEIGLANASSQKLQELVVIRFRVTGAWDQTRISVTTERVDGENGSGTYTSYLYGEGYRFQDVTADQWFYEAVDHMASEGYIQGISQSHFGPALNMNRASFVTLLGRLAGVPEEQVQTQFVDVPADSFYSGYVAWAAKTGITTGVDATHFNPTGSVSRAQMVAFLYRYAKSVDPDLKAGDAQKILGAFADAQDVLAYDWMAESFAWAIENGIINGMDGKLNPYGLTNRAQVAVMLYRFFFEA